MLSEIWQRWRQRHLTTSAWPGQIQQVNQRLMTSESKRIVFRRFCVYKQDCTRRESATAWDLSPQGAKGKRGKEFIESL